MKERTSSMEDFKDQVMSTTMLHKIYGGTHENHEDIPQDNFTD